MPVVPPNPSDLPPTATEQGDKEQVKDRHRSLSSQHDHDRGPSEEHKSGQGQERRKATALDHLSKGPQIPDEMPPKASREEIEARMRELNK
ncbi:hypothetical protein M432DRAFT_477206 [Thermoascus aurantiacus ATCC 26904]